MLCSQVLKLEDINQELKDLVKSFLKTAYKWSAVIARTIIGFIAFALLLFLQIITVMQPSSNFQFAIHGVIIYNAYPQELFPNKKNSMV
jgi:ABC-type uncharacterized transport system fused permease/ATPase subunit